LGILRNKEKILSAQKMIILSNEEKLSPTNTTC